MKNEEEGGIYAGGRFGNRNPVVFREREDTDGNKSESIKNALFADLQTNYSISNPLFFRCRPQLFKLCNRIWN
jgi:hypothetical protein